MREISDFSNGWRMSAENTQLDKQYDDSVVKLPFIHEASAFTGLVFTNRFSATDRLEGQTLYLEFRQVSGEVRVFRGDTLLGGHTGMTAAFRVKLTDAAGAGESFEIRVEVTPRGRSDGTFIFSRVSVVSVGQSHFDLDDCGGPGLKLVTRVVDSMAEIHVQTKIINPNNYDVVSYAVETAAGTALATKTEKPTGADTVLSLPLPQLWGGQNDAHLYVLKAALVRDTVVLDNLAIPLGIKDFEIREDKYFRVNGLKLPLNGVSLSDCSHLRTDKSLLELLDVNALAADSLPARTDLLYECDKAGTVVWFDMPYTGEESDFDDLRDFLVQNRLHPSLAFVCCSDEADADYAARFVEVCRRHAPWVFTAVRHGITDPAPLPDPLPDVVAVTIKGVSAEDDFTALRGRFEDLKNAWPDASFALFAGAPDAVGADGAALSESDLCAWHEKLWNVFCRDKSTIGFFAGRLTDAKDRTGSAGLVTYDRKYVRDAFWFYKSQFSAQSFVKICAAELGTVSEKKKDIRCYTNTPPATLTVDGNDKKQYEAEEVYDGVYVFRKVALKNKVSTVEAAAGDSRDSVQITFEKK
jgi:beta-galactosidase